MDIEGEIIMDRGLSVTIGPNTGTELRRRLLKIKDETGIINITIWNRKVRETDMHMHIFSDIL